MFFPGAQASLDESSHFAGAKDVLMKLAFKIREAVLEI